MNHTIELNQLTDEMNELINRLIHSFEKRTEITSTHHKFMNTGEGGTDQTHLIKNLSCIHQLQGVKKVINE